MKWWDRYQAWVERTERRVYRGDDEVNTLYHLPVRRPIKLFQWYEVRRVRRVDPGPRTPVEIAEGQAFLRSVVALPAALNSENRNGTLVLTNENGLVLFDSDIDGLSLPITLEGGVFSLETPVYVHLEDARSLYVVFSVYVKKDLGTTI